MINCEYWSYFTLFKKNMLNNMTYILFQALCSHHTYIKTPKYDYIQLYLIIFLFSLPYHWILEIIAYDM